MPFPVLGPTSRWSPITPYESRASRVVAQSVTSLGQTKYAYSDDLAIVNVPCRVGPYVEERPNSSERIVGGRESNLPERVVAFPALYESFQTVDRIRVDGTEYGITAVEHDGSKTHTRLRIILNKRP